MAASGHAQEGVQLPTIDVQAESGTGYQPSAAAGTTSRLPVPLLSTPQTVNVVPQQVIQDQNVSTVKDALRNVAGITFRAGEGGNQGDSPYIRGFSAQGDIFRDAIRDPGWYTRDAFSIDAVEVYKGPSSFLFGRGSTGGVINLVSKTAVDRNFVEGTITGNTGFGARATVDANAVANENVSARIVVMGQQYDIAGRDNVEENRYGVAPSLKVKVNDRTTATLAYIYQRERSIPDYGIPYLNLAAGRPRHVAPVSRSNWYGILSQPFPDTLNDDVHIATAKIEHVLNRNVKVTNTTRYSDVRHFQRNVFPEPNAAVPVPPNLSVNWTPNRAQVDAHYTLATNQTDVLAKFVTGSWEHTVAAGFDVTRETRGFLRNQFTGQGATNFVDPNPWRAPGVPLAPTASQNVMGEATDVGAFVADQIKLNRYFELLGGIRYEQFRFTQEAPLAAPVVRDLSRTDNLLSWRVGAVFHPTENSSIYAMHGTSFNPSAENLSISVGNPTTALSQFNLAPEQNETTEVGVKADVLGGKLSLASAVFWTEKTNLRVTDPTTSLTNLVGTIQAPGFEASAAGKITEKWQVIASYSYVHARIVETIIPTQLNNAPQVTPEHAFSLWSTYDIFPELQIGGGAFYVGQSWADLPNTAIVPAYWRFDAMAAYKLTPKSTLQLNVYNLTDEYYFASAYTNWAVPGPSRTVALTYRIKW
ncbi:MAG TPA: TonB-dependent siderophore receptor [Xanthobacteraceae bacterium]|nr:TonB-dependent siderophore receptor [Xanthobacteraceae bacterium]